MGSNKITAAYNPVSPFDLKNKSYVDVSANNAVAVSCTSDDTLYVKLTGGTIAGAVDIVAIIK